ncbi:cell division protein FtsZ [Porphyromonas sp.]
MDTMERGSIEFEYTQSEIKQLIKVVGVGGGGGNAVTKMYTSGSVPGVSFLLCNTDEQALRRSPVEDKITIGPKITGGLGAGAKPERAKEAALESKDEIRAALSSGDTRMVFITAGMGGGTGTGAAPIIGKIAMEMGLLTIGIVTIPFLFEGTAKILQALEGVKQMRQSVDALLVINNQRLIEVYKEFTVADAFTKADDTLSNAARGISDLVNIPGKVNLDFADVDTTLRNGGVAVINTGCAEGPNRMTLAIQEALNSPLLNNNNISKARHLLINVYEGTEAPLTVDELIQIQEFTSDFSDEVITIYGTAQRDDLGKQIAVTILASGFGFDEDIFTPPTAKKRDPLSKINDAKERDEQQRIIERVYGNAATRRAKAEPVALSISELDDEELLLILEETPSFRRDLRLFEAKRAEKQPHRAIRISHPGTANQQARDRYDRRDVLTPLEVHTPQPTPYQYTTTESTTTFATATHEPATPTVAPEEAHPEEQSEETPDNVIRFSGF